MFAKKTPLFLKHCGIGHLKKKTRLLPDFETLQNVPNHSFFKLCKFYEKINGQFLLEVKMCLIMCKHQGYSALYNANLYILTCKMPLLQKVK